jgi:hypothetical protein
MTSDELDKFIQDLIYLKTAPPKTMGLGYAKQMIPYVVHIENPGLKITYYLVHKKEKQSTLVPETDLDLMEDE